MSDIPKTPYTDLAALIDKATVASTAVSEGIATHADKEHAKRNARLRALEASHRMTEHRVVDVTQL